METIPARRGKATHLRRGQSIRIVNTHGAQVVDTWAFTAGMLTEFMSMEHTRATLTHLRPKVGDGLYTNRRRKILTMTEDTSRGDHDTLIAACDSERYILLGVKEYHDNCTDNLFAAMQALGLAPLAYGLGKLEATPTVLGMLIVQGGKFWYLDRMVLLFDEMKKRDADYARWEY